jgi:RNA-binding protein
MKKIGPIVRLSTEGTIIIRAQTAPPIGRIVCDQRGRDLGRIIRVTGPVGSPYVIVRPLGGMPEGLMRQLGRDAYLNDAQDRVERPHRAPQRPYDRREGGQRSGGQVRRGNEPRHGSNRPRY